MNPMPDGTYTQTDYVRPWEELNEAERRMFCRMAEVYAGFSEYTDAQVGRIVDYLEESGQLENTLIFYCADNGASGEGSPERLGQRGQDLRWLPRRPRAEPPHGRPARLAGHLQPLPDRLGDGVLHAVPDVQALHLPGRRLRPAGRPLAQGVSRRGARCGTSTTTAPTSCRRSTRPAASSCPTSSTATSRPRCPGSRWSTRSTTPTPPTTKQTQYYEMFGNRGIWHEGWKAVTEHGPISGHEQLRPTTPGSSSTPTSTAPRPTTSPPTTPRRCRSSSTCGSRRRRPTTSCRSTTCRSPGTRRTSRPSSPWSSTSPCRRAASTPTTRAPRRSRSGPPPTCTACPTRCSPRSSSPATRGA